MPSDPSFLDRALKRAIPRPVADDTPPPRELCSNLWVLDRQLLHFGTARLPTRTTIIRLGGGGLVVISPPPLLDPGSIDAINAIGRVESVVVPNSFHYLFASEFLKHYPSARLLAAPGLIDRVPELDFATELGPQTPEDWAGELEIVVVGPTRGVSEVMLFHRATGTLILTDLAFNMNRYPRSIDRFIWRLSGIPAEFGPGRTSRSLLLRDRDTAARSLSQAQDWPIRRIVLAHGDVIDHDAASRFRRAFSDYLPSECKS